MVDISSDHIKTEGLKSSLSYVARTDLDYGTLLCWGNNSLGVQTDPCVYKVIPAELPKPPANCSVLNDEDFIEQFYYKSQEKEGKLNAPAGENYPRQKSMHNEVLIIQCGSNNNMELPIKFNALILDASSQRVLANVTNSSVPEFYIRGLKHVSDLDILIHSVNTRGKSDVIVVKTRTSIDIAEKRTAQVRHNPSQSPILETQTSKSENNKTHRKDHDDILIIPILAIVLGVLGTLAVVGVVAILLLIMRKHSRSAQVMTVPSSLAESPDSNPDIIPEYGELCLLEAAYIEAVLI